MEDRHYFELPVCVVTGGGIKRMVTMRYYYSVVEVEVEPHEDCQGPDCDCWKATKPVQEAEK